MSTHRCVARKQYRSDIDCPNCWSCSDVSTGCGIQQSHTLWNIALWSKQQPSLTCVMTIHCMVVPSWIWFYFFCLLPFVDSHLTFLQVNRQQNPTDLRFNFHWYFLDPFYSKPPSGFFPFLFREYQFLGRNHWKGLTFWSSWSLVGGICLSGDKIKESFDFFEQGCS